MGGESPACAGGGLRETVGVVAGVPAWLFEAHIPQCLLDSALCSFLWTLVFARTPVLDCRFSIIYHTLRPTSCGELHALISVRGVQFHVEDAKSSHSKSWGLVRVLQGTGHVHPRLVTRTPPLSRTRSDVIAYRNASRYHGRVYNLSLRSSSSNSSLWSAVRPRPPVSPG